MKRKMLIVIDTIKPMVDGVSVFLDNILPLLSDRYAVTIIAPDYGEVCYENVKLIQFPVRRIIYGDYGIPKINRKIIKREVEQCDFVFNHESLIPHSSSFFALLYARKFNKPFFTYVHSIDWELFSESMHLPPMAKYIVRGILKIYGRWFLNRGSVTIASFETIEKILREKNKFKGRFEVAPVGTSDDFKPGKSKHFFDGKIVIGYNGRISVEKGLDVLLRAFSILSSKFNNLTLLIVGDGPDRNMFNNTKNVKITGFISQKEVAEYLRAMDIYVLYSATETSSISTLEAMKSGVCCVVTNVGCIGDYLKHGYNGYFIKNREELMEALERLITNEKLRKTLSKNAAESTLKYTWENTARNLTNFFDNYNQNND